MIQSLYEPFRKWSARGSVYIISDLHFGDPDCKHIHSNWVSPQEQIDIINKKVCRKDTIIILGDIGEVEYVKKIRGYKVLIMGNHDKGVSNYSPYFNEIYKGPLFISEKILLSHEPICGLPFCLNIHGHDHWPTHKGDATHINVAANVCGYSPINLKKIINSGAFSKIPSIHRITIDNASGKN